MGNPDFAVGSLRRIHQGGYNIVGVVTMPDKTGGRGNKVIESAVKRYATEAGLPCIMQPNKYDNLAKKHPIKRTVYPFSVP